MALPEPRAPGAPAAAALADPPGADAEPPLEPSCRVCYDGADDTDGGELLAPCQCQGTMRYIHQCCLREWLQHAPPTTRMVCSVCRTAFVLPPGFEVPSTDFDHQQMWVQGWEARGEAEWSLSAVLAVAGAAAGVVAAALLSVHLAQRYDVQQMEQQWRRQAKEERRHRKWLREKCIPKLEGQCAQLERCLEALRTCQRLDRWLPPPLVPSRQWRLERWRRDITVRQLGAELAGHQLQLARCKLQVALGSDADASGSNGGTMSEGSSGGGASASAYAKEAASGGNTSGGEPAQPHSGQREREALVHGRRHNLAEPLLRAVHSLLRGARRQ